MRISHTKAAYARLPMLILAALERKPYQTAGSIGKELGFGMCGVRSELMKMERLGKVHFVTSVTKGGLGKPNLWALGLRPEKPAHIITPFPIATAKRKKTEITDYDKPRRSVVQQWEPIRVRDPLVAFLFGEAK